MRNRTLKVAGLALVLASCLAAAVFMAVSAAPARAGAGGNVGHLVPTGSVVLSSLPTSVGTADGPLSLELRPAAQREGEAEASGANKEESDVPEIDPRKANPVTTVNAGFSGFNGLTHRNQRLANGGNQFSLEPPDQGLCVGNGKVLETVNTVERVRSTTGANLTGVIDLNTFFGLPAQIVRPFGPFGPFLSDPKCYFDAQTGRFFLTILEADLNPLSGDFTGTTSIRIAVSQTGDPTGAWNLFSLDTTNDCANGCLPDQPLIGADGNVLVVSVNRFTDTAGQLLNAEFAGAELIAISKADLVAGTAADFQKLAVPAEPLENPPFSLQPATTPPGSAFETAAGGTEFLLEATDFDSTFADTIVVNALTNTSSIDSSPNLALTRKEISTELYAQPPDAEQKPGPLPLGSLVGGTLEKLAGNDDRMNEVKALKVGDENLLFGAVNTAIQFKDDPTSRVGSAFFVVKADVELKGNGEVDLDANVEDQGYIAVAGENVLFPTFGVNSAGDALMTFTLVGPGFFPSAAYTRIGGPEDPDREGNGPVHLAAAGAGPEDGFSGYAAFGGNGTARWGDYSAATADESGRLWFATEFIPGGPRTLLANWGTFIARVTP